MGNPYEGMTDEEIFTAQDDVFFNTWHDPDTGWEAGHFLGLIRYANSEICNGGFHQFYTNGIFDALRLIDDLERLDNPKWADCVRQSLTYFVNGQQPKRGNRSLDEMWEIVEMQGIDQDTFESIEAIWYENNDDLLSEMTEYVRRHPDEFPMPTN